MLKGAHAVPQPQFQEVHLLHHNVCVGGVVGILPQESHRTMAGLSCRLCGIVVHHRLRQAPMHAQVCEVTVAVTLRLWRFTTVDGKAQAQVGETKEEEEEEEDEDDALPHPKLASV